MRLRSLGFMFLVLLMGAMVGSLLGSGLAYVLPEGVVKDFFLKSLTGRSIGGK